MISKFLFLLMMFSFVVLFSGEFGTAYTAIPASERAALIALYNSTNGDNWSINSGWKDPPLDDDGFSIPGTECKWHGVTCTGDDVYFLRIQSNQLSGSIPVEVGNLTNLHELDLNRNQLTGSIPDGLGNLSNLEFLTLDFNQLSGSIPDGLGNLSRLRVLGLAANQLTGSIPDGLGNLSNLEWLYLASNQLTGSIPDGLGNLSRLKVLGLAANQLTGSIPGALGNLTNLELLYLDDNCLLGEIPDGFVNLENLDQLNICGNYLDTNHSFLRDFLDEKAQNWESCQRCCKCDLDQDGDIDGNDLAVYIADPVAVDLKKFASNFGNAKCPCAHL